MAELKQEVIGQFTDALLENYEDELRNNDLAGIINNPKWNIPHSYNLFEHNMDLYVYFKSVLNKNILKYLQSSYMVVLSQNPSRYADTEELTVEIPNKTLAKHFKFYPRNTLNIKIEEGITEIKKEFITLDGYSKPLAINIYLPRSVQKIERDGIRISNSLAAVTNVYFTPVVEDGEETTGFEISALERNLYKKVLKVQKGD